MIPDRASQYTNVTGSGVLRTSLPIVTQFGGAGGIGGNNYAGGGGTYGGYGAGAGIYSGAGGNGVGGLHPPGVSLNMAYNTLVGLPTQQGQLGGGFGAMPGFGFPGLGYPGAFPGGYPGFPGAYPTLGTFPGGPMPFPGGFPAKFGGVGNGGYGF
jgi:hypothetical protein